jgi:hypothetical protein
VYGLVFVLILNECREVFQRRELIEVGVTLRVCPRIEIQVGCWAMQALLVKYVPVKDVKSLYFSLLVTNPCVGFCPFDLRNFNSWTDT